MRDTVNAKFLSSVVRKHAEENKESPRWPACAFAELIEGYYELASSDRLCVHFLPSASRPVMMDCQVERSPSSLSLLSQSCQNIYTDNFHVCKPRAQRPIITIVYR